MSVDANEKAGAGCTRLQRAASNMTRKAIVLLLSILFLVITTTINTKSKKQIKVLQSDLDAKSMELKALTEERDATKTHIIKFGEELANLKKENGELKAQVAEQIADHFGVAQTEILNLEKEISEHQSQMVKYRNKIVRHQNEMNNLRGSESATAGEGGDAAPAAPAEGGGEAAAVVENAAPAEEKKEEGSDGAPPAESAEPPARR